MVHVCTVRMLLLLCITIVNEVMRLITKIVVADDAIVGLAVFCFALSYSSSI